MAYEHQAWPSVRYGPDGQSKVCESEADVPEGWEDHPCKVECKAKPLDVVAAVSDMASQIAAMDGDGDGRIGGSLPKAKRKPKAVKRDGSR